MKKIIVTGGAGFIGSNLVIDLLKNKFNVLNIDKLSYAANLANLKSIKINNNYSFKKIDICNFKKLKKTIFDYRPEVIFHLAAETHVDNSIKKPTNFIKVNINGTLNILKIITEYNSKFINKKIKIIYVSTDEVYGSLEGKGKFTEFSNLKPNNPYSASKASGQLLVRSWYKTFNIPAIITNCSNNFGKFQHKEKFIPKIIISAINEQDIPIYGNGKNIRDWLFVEDHTDALITILKKGKVGEVYNIGDNNELSNLEIVKKICKLLDQKINCKYPHFELVKFVKDRKGHDFRYAIDSKKLKKLGWKPKFSFDKNLKKTVDWYLQKFK